MDPARARARARGGLGPVRWIEPSLLELTPSEPKHIDPTHIDPTHPTP
jgi:hypothetical protein